MFLNPSDSDRYVNVIKTPTNPNIIDKTTFYSNFSLFLKALE